MERGWARVHIVGPDERAEVGVYSDIAEEVDALQWLEDAAAAAHPAPAGAGVRLLETVTTSSASLQWWLLSHGPVGADL